MGSRPRQPGRLPRRLRPRRGGRPGRVRDRGRALAAGRHAAQSGRLADRHRPQPRDRPPAPRPRARGEDAPVGGARGSGGRGGGDELSRRAAGADLHVLPSVAGARGAGRTDLARARRASHRGDRPRVPRPRGDDEAAALAREAQGQRRGHSLPRPGRPSAPGAPGGGARGRLPDLQRGLRWSRRPRERGTPPRRGARRADAGRGRGARAVCADAARRRTPRRAIRRRRPRAARGPGSHALGHGEDRARPHVARPALSRSRRQARTSSRPRSRRCTWTSRTTGRRSPPCTASSPG